MRFPHRVALICVIGLAAAPAVVSTSPQDPQEPTSLPLSSGPGPERFNGQWDYNPIDSINIATGRPEQSPSTARRLGPGAAARPPSPGAGGAGLAGAGMGGVSGRTGGSGMAGGDADTRPPEMRYRALIQAGNRALMRDLLEIPESLAIRVAPDAVTFTDDLDREFMFPTGGKMQKYQVSASKFEARATWDGRVLRKEIEGPYGFRMKEAYFLSQDGNRLFVIIRVGEERPDVLPVGSNRVYDRIDQQQ
jgi:hypothetical protein